MQIHQEGQGLQKRMLTAQQHGLLVVQRNYRSSQFAAWYTIFGLAQRVEPTSEIACLQNSNDTFTSEMPILWKSVEYANSMLHESTHGRKNLSKSFKTNIDQI
jgi:hypothetical protein